MGSYPGIGASGAADLAGNFREWCWNASGELRYSLGGSWNEPVYMFQAALRMDPFDRSPANGFRCMKGRKGETAEELKASVDLPTYDFYKMEGLSDEVFQGTKMFSRKDTAQSGSRIGRRDAERLAARERLHRLCLRRAFHDTSRLAGEGLSAVSSGRLLPRGHRAVGQKTFEDA